MVLVITRKKDVTNIILNYINSKEIIFEKNVISLVNYVDKDLMSKNIEVLDKIIIDINSFSDDKNNLFNAISKIKTIYDIQIIIIAIGYQIGNELLSSLFDIGIYDFIISEDKSFQDEEFRKAIVGNTYIDSIKFKNKTDNKKSKLKIKKNKQISKKKQLVCFNFIKNQMKYVINLTGYILLMILISISATVLFNSNMRELLIKIMQGGN